MPQAPSPEQLLPSRNGNFLWVKLQGGYWVMVNPDHIMTAGLACSEETCNRPMTLLQLTRSHLFIDHRFEDFATFMSLWNLQHQGVPHEQR